MQDSNLPLPELQGESRICRLMHSPVIMIFVQLSVWFGSLFAIKEIIIKPFLAQLIADESVRVNLQGLLTLGCLFVVYYYLIRLYEKRPVFELAVSNAAKDLLVGVALGCAMITLLVATIWALGCYRINSTNPLSVLVYPLIWVPLMATVEEIMFRGIVFRLCEQAWGTYLALLVSAMLFGLLHMPNENSNAMMILSATTGGLLTCMAYVLAKNLWLPIGLHAGWNFAQVLWGIPVSGEDMFGVYALVTIDGPAWVTGGPVGIEGSVFGILLVILITCAMFWQARRKGKLITYPRKANRERASTQPSFANNP